MPVSATAKNTGISVKKLMPILDLVRGKNVQEAMDILEFLPSPAATSIARVVKSAASNAEEEIFARPADLTITKIYANEGPSSRGFEPGLGAARHKSSSAAAT